MNDTMPGMSAGQRQLAGRDGEKQSPPRNLGWVLAAIALISASILLAFRPVLGNGFVNWGDQVDLVNNTHFRGFSPANVHWMFTTIQMGHYQPLSWLTFALDFQFWGLNPKGYHLTSLLLHAGCAVIVFLLLMELLDIVLPADLKHAPVA